MCKNIAMCIKKLRKLHAKKIVVACDANARLPPGAAPFTGSAVLGECSVHDARGYALMSLMAKFGLCALNTCVAQEKCHARTGWDGIHSQIDFILSDFSPDECDTTIFNAKQVIRSDHFPILTRFSCSTTLRLRRNFAEQ